MSSVWFLSQDRSSFNSLLLSRFCTYAPLAYFVWFSHNLKKMIEIKAGVWCFYPDRCHCQGRLKMSCFPSDSVGKPTLVADFWQRKTESWQALWNQVTATMIPYVFGKLPDCGKIGQASIQSFTLSPLLLQCVLSLLPDWKVMRNKFCVWASFFLCLKEQCLLYARRVVELPQPHIERPYFLTSDDESVLCLK